MAFIADNLPSASGLMRSTLRDSLRRLKQVRVKAGKNDDAGKQLVSTGDPFRDKSNEFIMHMRRVKDAISERNEGVRKNGNDMVAIDQSNSIRRDIRSLETIMEDIRIMVQEADRMLTKETMKSSPKQKRVQLLQQQLQERNAQLKQCEEMIELVKKMDGERFTDGPQRSQRSDATSAKINSQRSKKFLLIEQLGLRAQRGLNNSDDGGAFGDGGGEMTNEVVNSRRLEDDPATREHMANLAKQEAQISRGLDRLLSNVGRLHELAREISCTIDMQNAALENTEAKVDTQVEKLRHINQRLTKLLKAQSPTNTFLYVACLALILGMVGFLLTTFAIV